MALVIGVQKLRSMSPAPGKMHRGEARHHPHYLLAHVPVPCEQKAPPLLRPDSWSSLLLQIVKTREKPAGHTGVPNRGQDTRTAEERGIEEGGRSSSGRRLYPFQAPAKRAIVTVNPFERSTSAATNDFFFQSSSRSSSSMLDKGINSLASTKHV
ncbi:uncharacterized protein J3R85_016493 [Psidium guajava]|nr:uncharacterized protein J3R85_016493 [Psidium guajava]